MKQKEVWISNIRYPLWISDPDIQCPDVKLGVPKTFCRLSVEQVTGDWPVVNYDGKDCWSKQGGYRLFAQANRARQSKRVRVPRERGRSIKSS